jgi:hypothetical protein
MFFPLGVPEFSTWSWIEVMATTQFLFENGTPEGVKRLVNPDAIQELVVEYSNGLLKKWSGKMSKEADKIIKGENRGFFGFLQKKNPILESGAVSIALYGDKSYGLSREDWKYLELLKSVRALQSFREVRLTGSPEEISKAHMKAALDSLVEDTKSDIFPAMLKDYSKVSRAASPKIEEHCLSVYGERCSGGEGAEIFSGDLKTSVDMGVIRTSPPEGMKVWKAFLPLILE